MNILLVFFAIPVAVIILSIILETYMKNSLKVAGIFFSIFIVFAIYLGGTAEYIVAALVYTLLSFASAFLIDIFSGRRCFRRENYYYPERQRRIEEPEFEVPVSSNDELTNLNTDFETTNPYTNCYRRYR